MSTGEWLANCQFSNCVSSIVTLVSSNLIVTRGSGMVFLIYYDLFLTCLFLICDSKFAKRAESTSQRIISSADRHFTKQFDELV